MSNMCLLSH